MIAISPLDSGQMGCTFTLEGDLEGEDIEVQVQEQHRGVEILVHWDGDWASLITSHAEIQCSRTGYNVLEYKVMSAIQQIQIYKYRWLNEMEW